MEILNERKILIGFSTDAREEWERGGLEFIPTIINQTQILEIGEASTIIEDNFENIENITECQIIKNWEDASARCREDVSY